MSDSNAYLKREPFWFTATMAVAALVILGTIIGFFVAVFADSDPNAINYRIDRLYKLGLLGAGFVTFCTIVWRGLIATKQADLQREQIDNLADQINETTERYLADQLQKGAQLISGARSKAHVDSGLIILNEVISARNPKFAVEAMNFVANFLIVNWAKPQTTSDELITAALKVMAHAGDRGFKAEKEVRIKWSDRPNFPGTYGFWNIVRGVRYGSYEGGKALGELIESGRKSVDVLTFKDTRIFGGMVDTTGLVNCHFRACKFSKVYIGPVSTFIGCDFSGAEVTGDLRDLREGKNYFSTTNPPRFANQVNWESYLVSKDAVDDID